MFHCESDVSGLTPPDLTHAVSVLKEPACCNLRYVYGPIMTAQLPKNNADAVDHLIKSKKKSA